MIGAVLIYITVSELHAVVGKKGVEIGELRYILLIVGEVDDMMTVLAVVIEPLGERGVDLFVDIDLGSEDDRELAVSRDLAVEQTYLVSVVLEQGPQSAHILLALTAQYGHFGLFLRSNVHDRGQKRLLDLL